MQPYLSIIAASRNDAHGGNILTRMQLFVGSLIKQCNRFNVQAELILVEWNPPEGRPMLQEILPKPGPGDLLNLRYIIVPAVIHQRYRRAKEIPLFQMIAKNVGIRRAKGEFILCTNVDVIFSDELFRVFAEKKLRADTYYRANRCDVPDGIHMEWELEQQLDWCSKHVIKRLGRDMRFGNASLEQFGLAQSTWIRKWIFDKIIFGLAFFWPPEKREFYQIDSFACGDFTLMSQEAWLRIKGYFELDLYSIHVDTLGLICAKAMGYRQHVFTRDTCIYHIYHTQGWESMMPVEKINFMVERPGLDYGLVYESGIYALKNKTSINPNHDNWGFYGEQLEEFVFPK